MSGADNAEFPIDRSTDLSNSILEHGRPEEDEDDDWVIIKKQRVVIWIPPPSPGNFQNRGAEAATTKAKARKVVRRCTGTSKMTHKLSKEINDEPASVPTEVELQIQELEKPVVTQSEDGNQINAVRMKSQPRSPTTVPPENGTQGNVQGNLSEKPSLQQMVSSQRNVVVQRRQGTIKPLEQRIIAPKLPLSTSNVAKQKLRALNLERKLQVLGGLRKWLVSKGLSRFIHIFEREKLGMYQLVNLTMDKLKDMGADAVGPRRKLIHAIDHLCQPYLL